MLNAFKWLSIDLGIDLGTANTLVYIPGRGIVLNQPSFVAINTRNNTLVAIGQEAQRMFGRTPQYLNVVRPLRDGVIADFRMATEMLKYFVKDAIARARFCRPRVVIAVPSGITDVEKKAVRDSVREIGVRNVTIILEPMAAAIGVGIPVQKPMGHMIVDIGGGTTDVAVITLAGIVTGHTLKIAGDEMDEAIIQYIKHKHNLLIGLHTAEMIKKTIGSAYPLLIEQFVTIRGYHITRGIPSSQRISTKEVREALAEPVSAIVEAIRFTLEQTPPEVAADIFEQGIILTGGGALLKNLDLRIKKETGLSVTLADEPLNSVVLGAGKVISDSHLLQRIAVD